MLRNYFLIALRTLVKNPLNSFIKVAGLAVGVAGCLIIFLVYKFETSFDTFHKDGDRIYRVYSQFSGVFDGFNRGVPGALPLAVHEQFTGLESSAHFQTYSGSVHVVAKGEKKKLDQQEDLALVSPDYFSVFSFYEWKAGTPEALLAPFSVAITEAKALQYFGTTRVDSVIGRSIFYNDSLEVTVAGLLKDVPYQTDFYFKDFISFSTIEKSWLKGNYPTEDWGSTNSSSQFFIKLAAETSEAKIKEQLVELDKKYLEQNKDADWKVNYHIQPLSQLHFNSDLGLFDNGRSDAANLPTLRMFMLIAGLLLLMAAINFINLETAQSIRRAKEVGLRKVMGSTRESLVQHFLLESGVLATVAVVLAIPLASLSLMLFSEFLPQGMQSDFLHPLTLLFLVATIVMVALLAGLYPAFILSGFQPAEALKNQVSGRQTRSAALRKVLTVFQFSFSQVLIVSSLVVGWQIQFMLNKDLGFNRDSVVTFYAPWWEQSSKTSVLQAELEKIPDVLEVSRQASPPAAPGYSTNSFKFKDGSAEVPISVHRRAGDTSFLRLHQLKVIAGRNVQPVDGNLEILVNRAFCSRLGFDTPDDMIGKTISSGSDRVYTIVGVLEDFHFRSLHHAIEPLYFFYSSHERGFSIKLNTKGKGAGDLSDSMEKLSVAWKKVYPDQPFEPKFLDDTVRSFYESEKRIAKLANTAMGITVFISCLGLLGLAAFTATQRTKEIGIRKVLGATVNNIVGLLSKEFLKLVVIALVLSIPVAWYAANYWLNDFAYKMPLSWTVFGLAGVISLGVAFATVGVQAFRAALNNPVDSLRYE